MSESEPIEEESTTTFIMVKSKKGECDPARHSVAVNLLTGYKAYGMKRARPIFRSNNGTREPR